MNLASWTHGQGDPVLDGVRHCGHAAGAYVEVYATPERTDWREAGIWSCGRIWLCPVCSAAIRARRASELDRAAAEHRASGGTLLMVTLTVRHSRDMALADTLRGLNRAFAKVRARTVHRSVLAQTFGYVKALEITYGLNGWHPHLHLLYWVPVGVNVEQLRRMMLGVSADWSELVDAEIGAAPDSEHGVDVRTLRSSAAYLSKVGPELAMGGTKRRSPFGLLEAAGHGDRAAIALWLEYARATHGVASLRWSPGLRDRFDLEPEPSLDVMAAEGDAPEPTWDLLARIPAEEHRHLSRTGNLDRLLDKLLTGWCPEGWRPFAVTGWPAAAAHAPPERRSVASAAEAR